MLSLMVLLVIAMLIMDELCSYLFTV